MFKYKKKAAVICFLYFLCVAVVTCYLYTIYVKGRINSVKVSIVDSGLAIANVSEYRRSVSNNIFYELEVSPEELLKKIRNSFAGYENPGYLYDLGPYMISDGKCIKVTTKGDNFCDDIVSSIRVINEFERGIISLKNKCYVYYAHPIAKRTSLISVVDPERYLSLIRNQSGEREDIYVSFYDINDNEKKIAGDDFLINDVVFEMSAITLSYSYLPEMMFIVAYKKSKYLYICAFFVFASAISAVIMYVYYVKLLRDIINKGRLEKESILSNHQYDLRGENLFFNTEEINAIREIYDFGTCDALTRASGRRSFDKEIKMLRKSFGYLCLFDVDKFKTINDKFGHLFGDEVLIKLVNIIKEELPRREGEIYRFGGDEFAIIYYEKDKNKLSRILHRVVHFAIGGLNCSCSIGVASTDECMNNIERLKLLADERLYKSKQNGRAQITWC
ncbi:GGDEF domain-containing protein [Escherichia ruysiae]|uniref:GGDEF domain-containing protein n=1 Tax=Escherichia ruysiae TaxID=2608867 RepID=UPI001C9B829A|nr:GGDEF domain-containing protein [Escherichia ruysiae]MBY7352565.1 GGDEF domain-containing protein [Escherichia ruysiae]